MDEDFEVIKQRVSRERILKLYSKYKKILLSIFIIAILTFFSILVYQNFEQKRRVEISEKYSTATLLIKEDKEQAALKLLKEIIYAKDTTYAPLALFAIIKNDLIEKEKEIIELFDEIILNNNIDFELKNLLNFKKAILLSSFANEKVLLETTNKIINLNSLWKPHTLVLLGDYYYSKKNFLKAKEFYSESLLYLNANQNLKSIINNKLQKLANVSN